LGTFFAPSTDFILCYSKNLEKTEKFKDKVDESLYKKVELEGPRKGEIFRDDIAFYQSSQKDLRPNQKYFVECPDGTKVIPPCGIQDEIMREGDGRWRWSKETYLQNKDLIVFKETKTSPLLDEFGNKSKYNLYTKSYLSDRQLDGTLPRNILTDFINRKGADLIKKLGINFDFTKPIELIEYLSEIVGLKKSDLVLDFFSGSSSTAHGIISYSVKKNENVKYIMVQIPEIISNSEFSNISDLGKERIRRASKKIKEENPLLSGNFDTGFKVFKLDSSNIKGWDGLPDNLENSLFESQDNIKSDRKEEDVLFEILLKYGLDLTLPIEEKVIEGKKVFNVGFGALFICLGNELTSKVAEGIGQWKETLKPETCRVIFKDGGFTDVEKTNSVQTLKRFGIQEIKSI
jgi:adenine-specific DNA-methyltransferase